MILDFFLCLSACRSTLASFIQVVVNAGVNPQDSAGDRHDAPGPR